jgi:hypothetical protein
MSRRSRFRVSRIEEALRKAGGIKLHACKALDCSRSLLDRYIQKHPYLAEVIEEVTDELLDVAETHVRKGVIKGDKEHVWKYLRTKGKHRGWTERTELTGEGGGPIKAELRLEGLAELNKDERDALRAILQRRLSGSGEGSD